MWEHSSLNHQHDHCAEDFHTPPAIKFTFLIVGSWVPRKWRQRLISLVKYGTLVPLIGLMINQATIREWWSPLANNTVQWWRVTNMLPLAEEVTSPKQLLEVKNQLPPLIVRLSDRSPLKRLHWTSSMGQRDATGINEMIHKTFNRPLIRSF